MKKKKSEYRCLFCGRVQEYGPNKKITCACVASRGHAMAEENLGVVTK